MRMQSEVSESERKNEKKKWHSRRRKKEMKCRPKEMYIDEVHPILVLYRYVSQYSLYKYAFHTLNPLP